MAETPQEITETNESTVKTEEETTNIQKPELEKTDSVEDTSLEQNEENADDFNSARSRSASESSNRTETGSENDASVILEREEGDGQESTPNRKVDDDEDKRNPQYIPKRGTFYEHDDRTAVDEEAEEVEKPENEVEDKEAASKKKVWTDKEASKWSHDKYNDNEQAPKSRAELVAIYGYDIRNEEGPPRARRRRRYGRGPNKYTRNWEDEDAYSKPTNVSAKPVQRKPRTKPGEEEFPPLNPNTHRSESKSGERNDDIKSNEPSSTTSATSTNKIQRNQDRNRDLKNENSNSSFSYSNQQQKNHGYNEKEGNENGDVFSRESKSFMPTPKKENHRMGKSPMKKTDDGMKTSAVNNVRGVTKTRGFFKNGGRGSDSARNRNQKNQKHDDDYSDYIVSQNFTNSNKSLSQQQVQKLEKDMANMSMQQTSSSTQNQQQLHSTLPQNEKSSSAASTTAAYAGSTISRGGKFGGSSSGVRQTSVPPRLQAEQRGAKRYSSIRQRSLPETAGNNNFGQHPTYFQAEYAQQSSTQTSQSTLLPHPTPSLHSQVPSANTQLITVPATSQPPMNPIPANGAPLMQGPPPQFAPQYPQAPTFIQAGVAPPAFIPQQPPPPQILNYAQAQFPQPQFPNFQHQQFNPVNQAQPAELYQPQGGITYYSTQNQQLTPRVPQKRVKAAIPIVPPPEHKEPRGRGRLIHGEQDSPGGSAPDTPAEVFEQNTEYQSVDAVTVQQ